MSIFGATFLVFRPFLLDASELMQFKKWQRFVGTEVAGKHSFERGKKEALATDLQKDYLAKIQAVLCAKQKTGVLSHTHLVKIE